MYRDTSKQTKLEILNYLFWNSEPKYSRGKKWQVLCPNQFGKNPGPKRTTFVKYQKELEINLLIIKIEPIKDRGNFYSITPLGLCLLAQQFMADQFSKKQIEIFLKILEPFAEKSTEPVKSIFFNKPQFKIIEIQNKLERSLGSRKVERFLPHVFQLFDFNEGLIDFSIPVLHSLVSYKLLRFNLNDPYKEFIKLLEHDSDLDKKYKFTRLSKHQFHNYFCILIISSLLYIATKTTFDPQYRKKNRDLIKVTLKDGKRQHGINVKPDMDSISNLDEGLFLLVISLNNSIERVLKETQSFHNEFIQMLRLMQFTKPDS